MKDEVIIKCRNNSIWARYIIEFLKFIGFSITVDSYDEYGSEGADCDKSSDIKVTDIMCLTLIEEPCEEELQDQAENVTIHLNNFENESDRKDVGQTIIDKISEYKKLSAEDSEAIKNLFDKYDQYKLFYSLYNEGLLKYLGRNVLYTRMDDDFSSEIKAACEASWNRLLRSFNELMPDNEDEFSAKDRFTRYAILLLMYKINDLQHHISNQYIFSSEKLLGELIKLQSLRAFYLAARICRSDKRFNYRFLHFIKKSLAVQSREEYSDNTKAFLLYQKAKFYETYNYSINTIKKYYEDSSSKDSNSYFANYKVAKYCCKSGNRGKAVEILNGIKTEVLSERDISQILPKRLIYGYRCCVFLGDIYFEGNNYNYASDCYESAIRLAIHDYGYFNTMKKDFENYYSHDGDNDKTYDNEEVECWKRIFYSCMPIRSLTANIVRICEEKDGPSNSTSELRYLLQNGTDEDLLSYWKAFLENGEEE